MYNIDTRYNMYNTISCNSTYKNDYKFIFTT